LRRNVPVPLARGKTKEIRRHGRSAPGPGCPWIGIVIVQARHINGYNRSFSELDFYSTSSDDPVIGKAVSCIQKLREARQL